jgi:hypothetical protein
MATEWDVALCTAQVLDQTDCYRDMADVYVKMLRNPDAWEAIQHLFSEKRIDLGGFEVLHECCVGMLIEARDM